MTNDPGRRDRRASRKLFDTLLSCPVFTYTTRLRPSLSLPLSSLLSLHFPVRGPERENLSNTRFQRRFLLWRERGGQQADANFLFGFFSFLPPCSRGGVRFDRTQETVNRSLAVRVPVISRLRDTGTDGSHCILIQGEILSLPRLECTGI